MPPAPGARPAVDQIGLQLYTVRDRMSEDVERTLDEVAAIGYPEVEFAGYFGRSPAQIRGAINAAGVHAPAAHVPFEAVGGPRGRAAPGDDWAAVLEAAAAVGHQWVVVAWIPQAARGGREAWERIAERFNEAGEAARAAGLRFAYHNHDFEFDPVGLRIPFLRPEGRGLPFDILIEETEPDLVDFEIDVFWTASGGADALEYFARHPGRFRLAHFKDMDAQGRMVDPGEGQIDFAAILARAEQAGLEHAFVEHDQPADSMATARAGFAHLAPMVRSGSGGAGA